MDQGIHRSGRRAAVVAGSTSAGKIAETRTTSYRLARACTAMRNDVADRGQTRA
jgi:hypothetical protein